MENINVIEESGEVLTKYQRQMMILSLKQNLAVCHKDEKEELQRSINALEKGFSLEYIHLSLNEERSIQDCELVINILDMFRFLKWSIKHVQQTSPSDFNDDDLQNIQSFSFFNGFDLNDTDENWMISYCRYVFAQDDFNELKDDFESSDRGNSHHPNLGLYKTMLQKFAISERDSKGLLKAQDIKRILDPRVGGTSRIW